MTEKEFELQMQYARIKDICAQRDKLKKENMALRRKMAHLMVKIKELGYVVCDNCGSLIDSTAYDAYYENGIRKICVQCLYDELQKAREKGEI